EMRRSPKSLPVRPITETNRVEKGRPKWSGGGRKGRPASGSNSFFAVSRRMPISSRQLIQSCFKTKFISRIDPVHCVRDCVEKHRRRIHVCDYYLLARWSQGGVTHRGFTPSFPPWPLRTRHDAG